MRPWAALIPAVALVLSGCGADDNGLDGECNARVRYAHALYIPDTRAQTSTPTGPTLGRGEVIDCDGSVVVDRTFELHSLVGVDPAVAIAVTIKRRRVVYVNQDVPITDWPSTLTGKAPQPADELTAAANPDPAAICPHPTPRPFASGRPVVRTMPTM